MQQANASAGNVTRIDTLRLWRGPHEWAYRTRNSAGIDRHWQQATALNPAYFNGVIHVIDHIELVGRRCEARLLATDFKSFLYWRDQGFPHEGGVLDGFGSALIRSSDGLIVLGRQRPGNINAGLAYLPGGFIDNRDIAPDGSVDIAKSIERELMEETGFEVGLHPTAELRREPGFLVTRAGPHVSFAVIYNAAFPASALIEFGASNIAAQADAELADLVAVSRTTDLDTIPMPHYARVLLASPLAWARPG